MTDGQWWAALVTFERQDKEQDILPHWAHGACGWMIAIAPDEDAARQLLARDLEHCGLRVLTFEKEQEVFSYEEVEEIDEHLADNFRNLEYGKCTVWGTLHGYRREGEA